MAELFVKQAKEYSQTRPDYPEELFQFIASKTPDHHLVWDAGTGSGQAAKSLAGIYENVIATDTSDKQLEYAPNLPNVRYQCTPPEMSPAELERDIAGRSTVDLITVAQAIHWFHLPTFYHHARWLLKKPHGVLAVWCYTIPEINASVDHVFRRFYAVESEPYWEPERKLVDGKYKGIEFPLEPVEDLENTGPVEFKAEKVMDLEGFLSYIRSWSAYQMAKKKGVELLNDHVVEDFRRAWNYEDGNNNGKKVVTFPVYLRIGKVGNSEY